MPLSSLDSAVNLIEHGVSQTNHADSVQQVYVSILSTTRPGRLLRKTDILPISVSNMWQNCLPERLFMPRFIYGLLSLSGFHTWVVSIGGLGAGRIAYWLEGCGLPILVAYSV